MDKSNEMADTLLWAQLYFDETMRTKGQLRFFLDRFVLRVDGELATARAEMAAFLASLQAVSRTTSVANGTDAESVSCILNRLRGKDSPPFQVLECMQNADLLGPFLILLMIECVMMHRRSYTRSWHTEA